MKFFKTIFGKILIAITITVLITVSVVSIITSQQINKGFDVFLREREEEIYGRGYGAQRSDAQREERHKELLEEFNKTTSKSILTAAAAGISLSLIISFLISKTVSNPLKKLKKQLEKISKNKYQKLDVKNSSEEINELVEEFNHLIDELKRVEQMREDLVSDVTHELKTPLTKITGRLEGCLDGVYKCDKEQIGRVLQNVQELESLISQLQRLVQIKARKIKIKKEDIKLNKFIENLYEDYNVQRIQFKNQVPQKSIIKADPNKLREILDNLLSNAIRYTKKGQISITYQIGFSHEG
jgi:signal transduction histidine kinase